MQDRDWYREERRRKRQASSKAAEQKPLHYSASPQKGPPSVFSVKSMLIISLAVIAVLAWQGFA
jgi:hypothetical protein